MSETDWTRARKSVFAAAIGAYCGNLALWLGPIGVNLIAGSLSLNGYDGYTTRLGLVFYLLIATATFVGGCLIGLPLQYLMQKRKLTNLIWYFAAYVSASMLLLFLLSLSASGFVNVTSIAYPFSSASLTVIIFWLVRRPDQDNAPIKSQ